MLPQNKPDRIRILFDDHRLVANAGLILPATLALRLGLPQLLRKHLDLGGAPGRANTGDKMMTLVASALGGGDCIDDADVLRAGGTARVLGFTAKAPSTLGTFLRSFRWGHVRQLDRVAGSLSLPVGLPFPRGKWNRHRISKGHLMGFVRPGPDPNMLRTVDVDKWRMMKALWRLACLLPDSTRAGRHGVRDHEDETVAMH